MKDGRTVQLVIDRQHVRAGHTEDYFDTQALHVPHDEFADSDLHVDSIGHAGAGPDLHRHPP
jgi:hypothetical protein